METKALSEYVNGGVESLVPAMEFLVGVMHYDRERSETIIKAAVGMSWYSPKAKTADASMSTTSIPFFCLSSSQLLVSLKGASVETVTPCIKGKLRLASLLSIFCRNGPDEKKIFFPGI